MAFIDLTEEVSGAMRKDASGNERMVSFGHLGTHFDVMNKEFPLDYLRLPLTLFDVRHVAGRDIEINDIDISMIQEKTFVAFYTGYIEREPYGTKEYFTTHPQLSDRLIDELLTKRVAIIGIDAAGIRMGKEHTPKDQYCADAGVFVVENLCNLGAVIGLSNPVVYIFPVKFAEMTGLPCRVVAEV